jgi:CheY-like chemotaxis protein
MVAARELPQIPAWKASVKEILLRRIQGPVWGAMPAQKPKILVVEDDFLVCAFATEVLAGAGYSLVTAHNATEALARIDAEPDIDLLFTDIVMPGGCDGLMLAEQAKRRLPHLKVLYTSGYAARLTSPTTAPLLGPFMPKPYRPQQLTAEIERAFSEPEPELSTARA